MKPITKKLKSIAGQASSGHYLDRLIAICSVLPMRAEVRILKALKAYRDKHCKMYGTDEVITECSRTAIYLIKKDKGTLADFRLIAWGLEFDALKDYDLIKARIDGNEKRKENI